MNTSVQLFRKRHIPEECIPLTNDRILFLEDALLITSWTSLRPRADFASGISLFDFRKHWKISRIAKEDGSLYYWYCDIMKMHIVQESRTQVVSYTMEDLLIDIIVRPDGSVQVLDLDEAAQAFERGLITGEDLTLALKATNELLRVIESGELKSYQDKIEHYLKG